MKASAKSDPNLIAYCGMYCGECPCFKEEGNVPDLARDLKEALRRSKFELAAQEIPFKEFKHYQECYDCLGAMVRLRCRKACKNGGGNPSCKIRQCCSRKGLVGCWQCDDFEQCEKLLALTTLRREALLLNLRNLKKRGPEGYLKAKKRR
jgi:hypothetical protein